MPPLALISATYISSVFFSGSPRNEAGPVTESTAPILMSACAVVIDEQLHLLAVDAAFGVDLGHIHLQRLLLGIAEERGRAGDREHRADLDVGLRRRRRSEEHTSELQSRGLISYAVF